MGRSPPTQPADDPGGLSVLGYRLESVYNGLPPDDDAVALDPGSEQLVVGVWHALRIRMLIQEAVNVTAARDGRSAEDAYLKLRMRAAQLGTSIAQVASGVIT